MLQKMNDITDKILKMNTLIFFFVLSIFTFFQVEILNDSIWFFDVKTLRIFFMLINFMIYFVLHIFIYSITNSIKAASIIGIVLFNIVAMINHYVCEFRGLAFRFSDIFSAGTAADVLSMYKVKLGKAHLIWAIILMAEIIFVIAYIKANKDKEKNKDVKGRIVSVILCSGLIVGLVNIDYSKIGINFFDGWNVGGYVVFFMESFVSNKIDKPEKYDSEKYNHITDITANFKEELPNIIVIMNESFADVERIVDIDTNKEVMPFFNKFVKGDNIVEGDAYVSVFAGNTANTEMEFLTGSTLGFWGKEKLCYTVGYQGNMDVLPKWMNNIGYATYAMHPARGENYSRRSIYNKMFFETGLFLDDYLDAGMKSIQYPKATYFLEDIIDDNENYKYVSKVIKEEEDPAFIFNITIQNHGGYEWREIDDIQIKNNVNEEDKKAINEYLTLLNQSDVALEKFIKEIENWEEDTIVLFFGDHQSSCTSCFYESIAPDLTAKDFYNTPFFIWANYNIETKHNVKTSINYLQNLLLETAGIGLLNEYQMNISKIQSKYPVLTPIHSEDSEGNPLVFEDILKNDESVKEYYHQSYKIIYDSHK